MKLILCAFIFYSTALAANAINRQKRISGSREAVNGEFPYHATLHINGNYWCGCTLISKFHLLIAAHCVDNIVKNKWIVTVVIGSVNFNEGKIYTVRRISYHKEFARESTFFFPNDIGIIHLLKAVELSDDVAPIGLPSPYSDTLGRALVFVTGHGCTSQNNYTMSSILMKLGTVTISLSRCQKSFPHHTLQNSNICTSKGRGYGCCYGDSGSPLVNIDKSTILGIVSASSGVCGDGHPEVYTKVSHYISYIQSEMNYKPENLRSLEEHPAVNYYVPKDTSLTPPNLSPISYRTESALEKNEFSYGNADDMMILSELRKTLVCKFKIDNSKGVCY